MPSHKKKPITDAQETPDDALAHTNEEKENESNELKLKEVLHHDDVGAGHKHDGKAAKQHHGVSNNRDKIKNEINAVRIFRSLSLLAAGITAMVSSQYYFSTNFFKGRKNS